MNGARLMHKKMVSCWLGWYPINLAFAIDHSISGSNIYIISVCGYNQKQGPSMTELSLNL